MSSPSSGARRPGKTCLFRSFEIVLDSAARKAEPAANFARTDTVMMQPKHLTYLSHGQFSLCRHSSLLANKQGAVERLRY
jgi:hypothetical protein